LKTMMSLFLKRASMVSFAATFMIAVYSTFGSGAAAQEKTAQGTDAMVPGLSTDVSPAVTTPAAEPTTLANLTEQLAAQPLTQDVSAELNCLAGAIYFEARNEPLDGQLAVGRVIVARTKSGRFPDSYCGVVYQPSQFSFIRHRAMPAADVNSPTWRKAVAVARIAHEGRWKSRAEGALYFHTARVRPRWGKQVKVARIENHVFYR
jgi:N-acetylmuramoyl-L-alanine amidase